MGQPAPDSALDGSIHDYLLIWYVSDRQFSRNQLDSIYFVICCSEI